MKTMAIDRINGTNVSMYQNYKPQQSTTREAESAAKANEPAAQDSAKAKVEAKVDTKPRGNETEEEESQIDITQEKSQKVKNAIAEVNKKMNQRTRCEFSYHEATKRVSIKVIDKDTDEVVREIPPEETLDMLSKMWEISGILVDEHR